jgi:PAS domain S-box-containing protein
MAAFCAMSTDPLSSILPSTPVADAIYRQLFLLSRDPIALIDLEGRYLEQNAAHRAFLGYLDEELSGRTPAIHFGDEMFAAIAEALRTAGAFQGEAISRTKDGRLLHVELTAFAVLGPTGEPIAYAGIKRDVTDRSRDRRELQQRYDRLQIVYQLTTALSESLPIADVYHEALSALEAGVSARRAAVLLYDESGIMRFKAWRGLSDGYRAAVEGHSPWACDEGAPSPIIVPDVEADPAVAAFRAIILAEGIRALAFVPLIADGRLFGKFMVYFDEPRVFTPDEVRFCQNIAEHIGLAIARQRRIERISALNAALTQRVKDYEQAVKELEHSQAALREKVEDLERFEEVVIGRELKMIQLEKELDAIRKSSPPT